jgi:hypothetical protein
MSGAALGDCTAISIHIYGTDVSGSGSGRLGALR